MSDSLDIQNLLQTGYFTTSRAKPTQIPDLSQPPSPVPLQLPVLYNGERSLVVASPVQSERLPPPIVEDEAESLAKEHGSPSPPCVSHEEPQSRGDIDQQPIMLEVHEHNPERRFVILASSSPEPEVNDKAEERNKPRPEITRDGAAPTTTAKQKQDPGPSREPSRHDDRIPTVPPLERRKSRQDLPPLETDLQTDIPYRQRSRSNTGNARPDDYSTQQSRGAGDTLLTPDVIKHGAGRREKVYHGYGKPSDGPSRSPVQTSQSAVTDSRPRAADGDYDMRRNGASVPKRTSTSAEPAKPMRRLSNERVGGPRSRDDYPTRGSRRDNPRPTDRVDGDKMKNAIGRPPWEANRDEHPLGPRMPGTRREKTIVVQEGNGPAPRGDNAGESHTTSRSRTRMPTMPLPSPGAQVHLDGPPPVPRAAATFPLVDKEPPVKERVAAPLPYPEEDVILMPPVEVDFDFDPLASPSLGPPPAVPTHGVPLSAPLGMERPYNGIPPVGMPDIPIPVPVPSAGSAYKPPMFDPARDGAGLEASAGSARRKSESAGQAEALPECPRTKPVAGMMDWLTLPRSDFNMCPDCYEGVFAKTSFRTQFQPMLRPTDKPIACDFGASPWYRVAWLLILKSRQADLRLFHQLASVMSSLQNQPCPGARRATRSWLTVRDPATQRPVRGFTICVQCAKIVEALLPNLTGLFVPLNSREPVRATCALHFTPRRRRFVMYFDTLELASDKALANGQPPDLGELAKQLSKLSVGSACREDSPIADGLWHVMQFLPQFTVCAECFDEVVRPRLNDDNLIARNFYMKPQRLPSATCQLYSERMRDIFSKACRRNDPIYLEDKVLERMRVESDIHAKLEKLDREGRNDEWVADQVAKLVREWQKWE